VVWCKIWLAAYLELPSNRKHSSMFYCLAASKQMEKKVGKTHVPLRIFWFYFWAALHLKAGSILLDAHLTKFSPFQAQSHFQLLIRIRLIYYGGLFSHVKRMCAQEVKLRFKWNNEALSFLMENYNCSCTLCSFLNWTKNNRNK